MRVSSQMRSWSKPVWALAGLALAAVLLPAREAAAIPAFARQMGADCTTCHYQHFPTLNGFGRMFKAGGYTMTGAQPQVEGNGLSLPGTLNAALLGTLQFVKGDEKEVGYPASLSLYFGGKMGKHSGFLMEVPFEARAVEGSASPSGDTVEGEADGALLGLGSLKWNYVRPMGEVNVGLHAFSTEMAGPAYGYELLSTGAMGMNVAVTGANAMGAIGLHMEHGSTLMSQFMAGMGDMMMAGAATGFGVTAQTADGYVYAAKYFAGQKVEHVADPQYASYLRAVWTPSAGGFDMGLGVQFYRGSATTPSGEMDAVATAADFQAQGMVSGVPVGIYATWATAPKSTGGTGNWYNMSTGGDNRAVGLLVDAGLMDGLTVALGYVKATYWMDMVMMGMPMSMKTEGTSTSLAVDYLLAPNKRLGAKYARFGGDLDDTVTEVTLQIGF